MPAIITHSWFETALDYKTRILETKIEEFPCLVHKLSVTLTAVKNGVKIVQTTGYNGSRTVDFITTVNMIKGFFCIL